MTKKKEIDSAFSYCRDVLARDDPDRYLASLFAPRAARPAIWAILAFNQDVARVRDSVTEPTLGFMRLQWMRDQVGGIYKSIEERRGATPAKAGVQNQSESNLDPDFRRDGTLVWGGVSGGPVYRALAQVIEMHNLPHDLFNALIDAREFDLGARGPQTRDELINYADRTMTPLMKLCGSGLDPRGVGDDALRDIAIAYALVGLVRASQFHTDTRGWNMIPPGEDASTIIKLAQAYLNRSLRHGQDIKIPMIRAMAVIADIYGQQIEKARFDLSNPTLTVPPPFLALRVWARGRGLVFFK